MTEEVVEDIGTNALDPTPAPEIVETAVATELPAEEIVENPAEQPPKEHGNKGKTPWYMDRINEETNKRQELAEQLAQERREKLEAQAIAERLQGGDKIAPTKVDAPQDIEALIEARAEQKLFNNDCNLVAQRGQSEIPGFNDKLGLLRSIGVVNDDFLKDIFAVDKDAAHTILETLSQDPEKASLMVKMDSRRRISELTRMTMAPVEKPAAVAAPKPAAVSKVPAPKPVVDASNGMADKAEDEMTDAEWSAWRKKELTKKFG